jgi:vancomycin resistance protein YoaR
VASQSRRVGFIALWSALGVIVVLFVAWAIDSAMHSGEVMRNVSVAGEPVGGLDETELRAVVTTLAESASQRSVTIETPNGTLETTAASVGLDVDSDTTVDRALDAGRDSNFIAAPFVWFGSLFTGHSTDLAYEVDGAEATAAVAELDVANLTPPTEPALVYLEGELVALPGQDGVGLDLAPLPDLLLAAAEDGKGPMAVTLSTGPRPPKYTGENIQRVALEANELAARGLTVTVDGESTALETETLKSWMRSEPSPDGSQLVLTVDVSRISEDVTAAVGQVGTPPTELSWNVEGDTVSYTEGTPGTTCCADDSAERVVNALRSGQTEVELGLTTRFPEHDAAWAASMQITQQIASFTTNHACCESRVTNIQRIADLTRGVVIAPGETFSVNEHVGQRTTAKGFAEAGVIYSGVFTTDVGGGVSQYATTLFNAAFFAGLEIPEYMAHTIYISRYPYGREATLSYPSPDLKIHNNTPFGVLIWPTYTGTSITVNLYSTPWITADQTGQSRQSAGACTRVITERTRTWLADGRQEVDTVSALYQPAEGVRC